MTEFINTMSVISFLLAIIFLIVAIISLIRKKGAKKWFISVGVSLVLWLVFVFVPTCNHEWKPATCTDPKTCTKCGQTEGESLGHTAGEMQSYTDYVSAKLITTTKCKVCSKELSRHEYDLSKFYYKDQFTFSPSSFTLRFCAMLDEISGCKLTAECVSSKNYIVCNINDSGNRIGYIAFSDGDSLFSSNQKYNTDIKTIMLSFNSSSQNLVYVVHSLVRTCDPSLDFDKAKTFSSKLMEKQQVITNNGLKYAVYIYDGDLVIGVTVA